MKKNKFSQADFENRAKQMPEEEFLKRICKAAAAIEKAAIKSTRRDKTIITVAAVWFAAMAVMFFAFGLYLHSLSYVVSILLGIFAFKNNQKVWQAQRLGRLFAEEESPTITEYIPTADDFIPTAGSTVNIPLSQFTAAFMIMDYFMLATDNDAVIAKADKEQKERMFSVLSDSGAYIFAIDRRPDNFKWAKKSMVKAMMKLLIYCIPVIIIIAIMNMI